MKKSNKKPANKTKLTEKEKAILFFEELISRLDDAKDSIKEAYDTLKDGKFKIEEVRVGLDEEYDIVEYSMICVEELVNKLKPFCATEKKDKIGVYYEYDFNKAVKHLLMVKDAKKKLEECDTDSSIFASPDAQMRYFKTGELNDNMLDKEYKRLSEIAKS